MRSECVAARPRAVRALAVAACGMLALTACSKAPSEAEDDRVPTIDEQIGLDDEGLLERQVQAENRVRDCMKAQGFDYVPVDPNAQRAALVGQTGMSSEDFEKQFGYGITTLYEQRLAQVVTGPNKEIRDALPEADRLNYDRTLYGDDPTATFQDALDSGDFTRLGGCIKQATEAVFGGTAVLQTLQTKLDEVDDKIFSDERMVKAIGEWSACMREAGYDGLADPDEVDVVLETKLEEIVGSPQERAAYPAGEGPEYDPAALKALQQEEVAMVAADIKCEKEHLEEIEEKVTAEYHTEFRQENADLLDAVPPL